MIAISTRTLYFNQKDTFLYIKSESRKGEGIVIFIHDSVLHKLRNDLSIGCEDIESLSIDILNSQTRNIIFNVIYRPPNDDLNACETFFKKILSDSTTVNKPFLAGDFNINLLDFETNKKVQSFVNLMFEFSMIPTINKPTRVTKHTATAIDNIITNCIINSNFKSTIVYSLTNLYESLTLSMILKNMYTSKILLKTHLIALNRHYLRHLGIVLKT